MAFFLAIRNKSVFFLLLLCHINQTLITNTTARKRSRVWSKSASPLTIVYVSREFGVHVDLQF